MKLRNRVTDLFRLDTDLDREGTVKFLTDGVVFQGTNVWALILAIFVASIGLNLNSPAVIIGAMLISPLMGPITGAGMALAIFDTRLLRRSLVNLTIMTVISLIVSTVYFWLSPLGSMTSELQARTTPTFYDVLVASLGGAALMVGVSRKVKSANLLAGVAIATALMPPLCTAGYGLATRNLPIFAGSFYLYLINSVFIGLVTFVFSKAFRLGGPGVVEQESTGKVRLRHLALTGLAVLVFITPSVFIAYDVVKEASWRARLTQFEQANLSFPETQVLDTKVVDQGNQKVLEISMIGAQLSEDLKSHLNQQLARFGLSDLTLKFVQPTTAAGIPATPVPDSLALVPEVTREVSVLFPALANLAWGDLVSQGSTESAARKDPTAFARWSVEVSPVEKERLAAFLRLRLERADLNLIHEVLPSSASAVKQ